MCHLQIEVSELVNPIVTEFTASGRSFSAHEVHQQLELRYPFAAGKIDRSQIRWEIRKILEIDITIPGYERVSTSGGYRVWQPITVSQSVEVQTEQAVEAANDQISFNAAGTPAFFIEFQ